MNVTDSIKGWIKHPFVKNVTDLANRPLVARVTKFVSGDDNTLGDWVNKARDLHNFLASGRIEQSLRAECNKILREYKGEIDLIEKGLSLYSLIQGKPNTNADGTVLQHEKPKQLLDILKTTCGNTAAVARGGSKGVQTHNYMHAYMSSVGSAR